MKVLFVGLAVWYVSVCVAHYTYQRPLWNDELAVYDSIRDFKPHQFFSQPLQTTQVFPRVYLFLIQCFAGLFNDSLLSLRFFAFVAMLAAFALWQNIARRELKTPAEQLTFMLCWVASVPLIYYSAELKQYSMDVLLAGVCVWFLGHQHSIRSSSQTRYVLALTLLPIAVFFSYPAYFFLPLIFWNLWLEGRDDPSRRRHIAIYLLSLGVCVTLSYLLDIRHRPVKDVTAGFSDYFIQMDSIGHFFQSLGEGVNNLFSRWFVELPKVFRRVGRMFMLFGLVYMFAGFAAGIKGSRWRLNSVPTIALAVFGGIALAGVLQKYPFGVPRTALFLCPMILILTIKGIASTRHLNRYVYYVVHGAFVGYLAVVAVGIFGVVFNGPLIAIPEIFKP